MPAFIETQFPIARLSAESFRERKAVSGQTLTGLGKWWGRKPLILVRAAILGMLMPASNDPKRDREIFLKILTMDDAGTVGRWRADKRFTVSELSVLAKPEERAGWNEREGRVEAAREKVRLRREASNRVDRGNAEAVEKTRAAMNQAISEAEAHWKVLDDFIQELQIAVFQRHSYAERLTRCERPENVAGPTEEAWGEINAHLGTTAASLPKLVEQLGQRAFGHAPRVGDCFCGGGSIPFEAARIGCHTFGSDLNPVAGLLSWASLNLLGGDKVVQDEVRNAQKAALAQADQQITEWRIEHNEHGERAEAFLYCVEVKPEGCEYRIPLAPSWVVDEYLKVIVRWHQVPGADCLKPEVAVVSRAEIEECKRSGTTVVHSRVVDPYDPNRSWSIEALRGPDGLRRWTNDDVVPRPGDVFQERLYCIRWVKTVTGPDGRPRKLRRYAAPEEADLARETRVLDLLSECFVDWQRQGFIPSRAIPGGGDETDRLFRERGWTYWHHLFTPRQLLTHGLISSHSMNASSLHLMVAAMLNIGRLSDWNSRLSCWLSSKTQIAGGKNTFLNQALNTLFNYSTRPLRFLESAHIILSSA